MEPKCYNTQKKDGIKNFFYILVGLGIVYMVALVIHLVPLKFLKIKDNTYCLFFLMF